jgi:hypothetical protein
MKSNLTDLTKTTKYNIPFDLIIKLSQMNQTRELKPKALIPFDLLFKSFQTAVHEIPNAGELRSGQFQKIRIKPFPLT